VSRPGILLTNDDGFQARGLWAAAEALSAVGEVTVAAPDRQWSGAGRSFPRSTTGRIERIEKRYGGGTHAAFAVDGSPAQVVLFALLEILPSPPALVVSGINLGENVGFGITMSGTVGAAMEAAAADLPALAVSQATRSGLAEDNDSGADFSASGYFTELFARKIIALPPRADAALWKVDVPVGATKETPWELTRLSRTRYYQPMRPDRKSFSEAAQIPYRIRFDPRREAEGSDVHALHARRIVSVTPLSLDFTARDDFSTLEAALRGAEANAPKKK
jgi:5'-nucleotidase